MGLILLNRSGLLPSIAPTFKSVIVGAIFCGWPWGVKFEPISWFIFHPIFIPSAGMVGKRAVKSGFIIEFIVAKRSHPTNLGEEKVIKIPEI
ncbi:MAG: hypothetical protein DRR16_20590 [Candidatus Parabeggiatoa sp. nov. 3]|nr:MAG: hypothetical protein DRR00_12305 [Gammaproteobacteria bacterium]RKZ66664.1 MAG: hypothetical protein DRQ99_09050 [Gammaproteobacteria bacterium]RKZ82070.1 MAG: hypothetical protein DRR16_20590 [Gammaproteobacteria bacterium]